MKFRRILLKISGEALAGTRAYGIDFDVAVQVSREIKAVHDAGVQIALIIGGGNIFRGVAGMGKGIDRVTGDAVGMLATVINALILREVLENSGVPAVVLTAQAMESFARFYVPQRAREYLEQGMVVIIAGGTGNPFFSTDTAAALRCAETQCDALIKATKVDGIYTEDPVINPNAVIIPRMTHEAAIRSCIRVMDTTAFSLCMENDIPIVVLKLLQPGNLYKLIAGETVGSIVTKETES